MSICWQIEMVSRTAVIQEESALSNLDNDPTVGIILQALLATYLLVSTRIRC